MGTYEYKGNATGKKATGEGTDHADDDQRTSAEGNQEAGVTCYYSVSYSHGDPQFVQYVEQAGG